jgi:hypothetical protein
MSVETILQATDELAALNDLEDRLNTDGLPVVIPTPERVARQVLASGYDGDLVIGRVPPRGGIATVELVAANAVMAGCMPDHFPVVLAAVQAALDPEMDLAEVQSTTNPVSPFIIVNGPARWQCGVASGHGALGPGHRANATIGRALRLVLMNVGGARPGEGDMALLGHGSKFTACLAEAEESSPFEPYHVYRGWEPNDSVVTLVGSDAPQAVAFVATDDIERSTESLLELICGVIRNPAHAGTYSGSGSDVVVMNPDHAELFRRAGLNRSGLVAEISRRATNQVGYLRDLNPSVFAMAAGSYRQEPDESVLSICQPNRLIVIVAGGRGAYSWVMRSWGAGPHLGSSLMKRIQLDQQCDIPLTR